MMMMVVITYISAVTKNDPLDQFPASRVDGVSMRVDVLVLIAPVCSPI